MDGSTSRGDALDQILSDPAEQYRLLVEESSDVLAIHEPDGAVVFHLETLCEFAHGDPITARESFDGEQCLMMLRLTRLSRL